MPEADSLSKHTMKPKEEYLLAGIVSTTVIVITAAVEWASPFDYFLGDVLGYWKDAVNITEPFNPFHVPF